MSIRSVLSKIGIGVGVMAVVALCGYAGYLYWQNDGLAGQVSDGQTKIATLTKQVTEANGRGQTWKEKYEAIVASNKQDMDGMKASVEAFAVQAAACDRVKKQLHVRD